MNRRKFLTISALTAGAVLGGVVIYKVSKASDVLDRPLDATRRVLTGRFGKNRAEAMIREIRQEYDALAPNMPYIGGEANIFTEWLTYGVYYLAVCRVLKTPDKTLSEVGKIIYETYEAMADYPKWLLRLIGKLKYSKGYVNQLREAAADSQKRQYPGDWVSIFIEGDGEEFDYGLDIIECGICKYYHAEGADELAPYICLGDYVVSRAFDRGLVRYKTLAEGADKCDFRYKKGRETLVYPLRDGWPPKFLNESGGGFDR